MKIPSNKRLLEAYAGAVTAVLALIVGMAALTPQKQTFDEITVHRINIVEPGGTLRMVISDHAKLPGVIVKGEERPSLDRPQAGMLFYNDEGSENGGLVFGGHKNATGEIIDSGGSLSFDKYGASGEMMQLAGVSDSTDQFAGLKIRDSSLTGSGNKRVWVGHTDDGTASVALMDAKGRKRIVMAVKADGTSNIDFLDASGKVIRELVP